MRAFWPSGEAAQAHYEMLRAGALAATPVADLAALRFARGGLVALLAAPSSEPVFVGVVTGAPRPAWSAHRDPRLDVLAAGYGLLLDAAEQTAPAGAVQR